MKNTSCICLFSYIKPQLASLWVARFGVVYVSFPTSNHNMQRVGMNPNLVVYVSFPTSNHNSCFAPSISKQLYMSLFLHQTTT